MLRSQRKLPNLNFAMPPCPPLWPHVTTLEPSSEHPRNIMPSEFWQILWEKLYFNLKFLESNGLYLKTDWPVYIYGYLECDLFSFYWCYEGDEHKLLRKGSKFFSPLHTVNFFDGNLKYTQLMVLFINLIKELTQLYWFVKRESLLIVHSAPPCPSVRPHGTTRLLLNGFSLNLIF